MVNRNVLVQVTIIPVKSHYFLLALYYLVMATYIGEKRSHTLKQFISLDVTVKECW